MNKIYYIVTSVTIGLYLLRKITTYFTNHESAAQNVNNLKRTAYSLISPQLLRLKVPNLSLSTATVAQARVECAEVLNGQDDRLIVIIGPCSIHHSAAALDYAERLNKLKLQYSGELLIIMRAYLEKPRSTGLWKGFISDPDMNGTCQIIKGLKLARKLLVELNEMGMPVACEVVNPLSLQYIGEFISWGAVGARTAESQLHREVASGVDFPIGFKNGMDGECKVAIDAVNCANRPHQYIGVSPQGKLAIAKTTGNRDCHVILRGGRQEPNYDEPHVRKVTKQMENDGLQGRIMIDCSHGNSRGDHLNQIIVSQNVASQIAIGDKAIIGVMIESNIEEGRQDISPGLEDINGLKYGVSVTDTCVSLPQSAIMLEQLARAVLAKRKHGKNL